jgi:glycine cleavage system T protein/glycine cleavage system H protein
MIDFSGWDMPIQYGTGPREEHLRVRSAAGIFDIDHMGRFEVEGPDSLEFLQRVQTWDVSRIGEGRAHYSLLCSESGGIIDDIFLYHLPRSWLVIVNASNTAKDLAWMQSQSRGMNVSLRNRTGDTCMLALQGPAAREILKPLCDGMDLDELGFHRVRECSLLGVASILCTAGYTGEPGCEMLVPAGDTERLWAAVLKAGEARGLIPCGLGARDSLRVEACLPLYGNEIDESTDPISASLARAAVCMDGHEFVGKQALGGYCSQASLLSPGGLRDGGCGSAAARLPHPGRWPEGRARNDRPGKRFDAAVPRHGIRRQRSCGAGQRGADRHQGITESRADRKAAILHIAPLEVTGMEYRFDEKARYSKTHEWVRMDGAEAVVGITDYAQNKLSDVVFTDLPAVGKELKKETAFMVIESVKAAEDVFSPVSGAVTARNEKLVKAPELVNKDPFGDGWLVRVRLSNAKELDSLLDPASYRKFVETL